VYSNEIDPYLLPMCITSQFFSPEYFRQILAADFLQFISKNQKVYFTLLAQVFSFIIKSRSFVDVINKLISSLGLEKGDILKYDPHRVISKKHIALNYAPYQHHSDLEI
jgi:hypothetical protein